MKIWKKLSRYYSDIIGRGKITGKVYEDEKKNLIIGLSNPSLEYGMLIKMEKQTLFILLKKGKKEQKIILL